MVSKNNAQMKDRYATKQVPHYGIRKLSVGVASVLLSTTLYMGVTAHADTMVPVSQQPAIEQPTNTRGGTSTGNVTANAQPTEATNVTQPAKNLNVESDNNGSTAEPTGQSTDPAALMTNFAVTEQPVDDTHNPVTTTLTSKVTWAIHYTDESGKKLLPDSVITHDYTRTDTGNQMGNWVYVPDSAKVTGTSNAGYNIKNPSFKFDQAAGKTTFDFATWQAAAASIDGYTPNYGSVGITDQLPKNPESLHATSTVDSGTHEFTFVYTANDQSTQIVFVDKDGETIDTVDVNGKTGETVQTNAKVPDKWKLVDNETIPSTITFSADTPEKITVHVEHKIVTKQLKINTNVFLQRFIKVSYDTHFADRQGYETWINDDEFNSKESVFGFGKFVNAGSVTGSVQYDLVSGKIVKVNNGETLKFGKTLFNYPSYEDIVNGGSLSESAFIDGVKKTFADELNEITHENLNYKVYASANLTKDAFTNKYLYGPGFNINDVLPFTFENGKQYGSDYEIDTSTINSFSINFNDLANNFDSHDIHENDDGSLSADKFLAMPIAYQPYISKTVTRTINVTNPDGTVKTIKQTAEINQNVGDDYDYKVHHGDYLRKGDAYVTDNNWTAYTVPTIDGYTASQNAVEAVAVNGNTTDQTVNITYTANPQTTHINYVDAQRKLIHTTTVNGQTDQTVEVPNEVPDGWMLYSGQSIPKSITFQTVNNDRDYIIKHVQSFVLSTAPKEAGTIIEGTNAKTYPAGVSDADLNKTITRTILVKDANGRTVNTKTQTVHFVRNAVVDAVTGHVDYLDWSEDGSHIFAAYTPVPKNGYTINSAKTVTVTPKDTDSTIELTYKAIPKTITVEYMTTDGKQIASQAVKADDNNQVKFVAPDGYVLATNTNTVDVSDLNDNIYRVLVRANEQTYTAGSTNIPKNVKNLTKVVTRTIVIAMPNGHRRTIKQRVTFERTATVKSDGSVVYTDYQPVGHNAFNHIFIAHRFGYNLNFSDGSKSVTRVDHITADTPDQTIVVTYVHKNAN